MTQSETQESFPLTEEVEMVAGIADRRFLSRKAGQSQIEERKPPTDSETISAIAPKSTEFIEELPTLRRSILQDSDA
jgi:hypothetical protein